MSGLGKVFDAWISIGNEKTTISVDVPYEIWVKEAVSHAVGAAMPALKKELPGLMTTAVASAMPALKAQMPGLMSAIVPELNKQGPAIIKAIGPPLEDYINKQLWPNVVRPLVMKELATGTSAVGITARRAGLMTGGVALAGILAFFILRKKT